MKQDAPEIGHSTSFRRRRHHFVAFCIYALLAVIVTWPLFLHFNSEVISEHYFDRLQNLWNIWWTKVALLDQHTNPFHSNLLLYPQGVDLYFHTLNLPSTLFTLLPFLLFGLAAAYNASVFFALVLSGYAGYRLVYYLTKDPAAGMIGGMIIGFNPLTSVMIRAQINVASLQWFLLCIEFFLRGWNEGGRRNALLCGLFFSLAVLTVAYFEIYLFLFLLVFLVWMFFCTPISSWRKRVEALARQGRSLLIWGVGLAFLLIGPYVVGAWLSLQTGQITAVSPSDQTRVILNSADLISFFVPNRGHWLLGGDAPWWQWISPDISDYTYLGVVTLGLAAIGMWFRRGQPLTWMWVTLSVVGAVLALGPELQVNNTPAFVGFMPFAFLQKVPLLGLARSPERFVVLTYLSLGVLAGWGVMRLLKDPSPVRRVLVVTSVLGLLLLEMPLRTRLLAPIVIPASLASLGGDGTAPPGAVLELPLTQHGRVDVDRMLYQTAHGRPITSAYLSRDVIDPYEGACSPLRPFRSAPERFVQAPAPDIISPTVALQYLGGLLEENGFAYIVVYKQGFYDQNELTPVPGSQLSALQEIARDLGVTTADDDMATIYRLRVGSEKAGLFMQLDENWHGVQDSYGLPFRWINGASAAICVHSPGRHSARLAIEAASFGSPRRMQVWVGDEKVAEVVVPADVALHSLTTADIEWPAGPQSVRFVVPEGSISPWEAGQGGDRRQLSIGLGRIRLEEKGSIVGAPLGK